MNYPYAKGDLLRKPNTYFYTKFVGVQFLKHWQDERERVQKCLNNYSTRGGSSMQVGSLAVISQSYAEQKVIDTRTLLISLIGEFQGGARPDADQRLNQWLLRLVKKFETTKRVHEAYGENFLAADKTKYKNIELYLLVAEVFSLAYDAGRSLVFLNVYLKVMDTLCSQYEGLSTVQQGLLSNLIKAENRHITDLKMELEVTQ